MVASARVAYLARRGAEYGVEHGPVKVNMETIRRRKREIVESFRGGSETRLKAMEGKGLDVLKGRARFVEGVGEGGKKKRVSVLMNEGGEEREITGDEVFINVGCRPASFTLPGLEDSGVKVLDSTTIMEVDSVPAHLVVVGGGYVGVEFAQMFRRFGSQVTLIHRGSQLLAREDPDIAEEVAKILTEDGIEILMNAQAESIRKSDEGGFELSVRSKDSAEPKIVLATHLLAAAGRVPNTDILNTTAAGLETNSKGFIKVDEQLRTNIPGIWALGDVKGGAQFTHVSYDDFRILKHNLLSSSSPSSTFTPLTTTHRPLPYTIFTDPQLGRIGHTSASALASGFQIQTAKMPMSYVARALEMDEARGVIKVVVDAQTGKILGAAVLGIEGGEVMTMLQIAMMGDVGWRELEGGVFAHPGLGEGLNNLWGGLE